ncbi:MAG: hypothetical protein MJ175_10515, partial [Clostridia bacterium]|nr:hypothetical protein [Clostridia bacterium]
LDSAVRACELLNDLSQFPAHSASAMTRLQNDVGHTLSVCEMLIDLHIPLTKEEEDTLLTAVLLHIYPDYFPVDNIREIIVGTYGFAPAVSDIIDCITPPKTMLDEEQDSYYRRIEENKLALLAALADRGDIVSKLHRYSTWNAHRYIEETKVCYYPMCIYGKEHYHALLAPISVLMEKIRSLLEVAEILLRRYEVREAELIQDIQALREENATIKGIIAKFRASSQKGAPAHDSESQL